MPLENFRFFALRYLDDWCADDGRFVFGLAPENEAAERLAILREAAAYYKVSRTLPTLVGEVRLTAALRAIDDVAPFSDDTVDAAVTGLASRFQTLYGRNALSAASKFLWLRHKTPVVILDDQAGSCLRTSGCRFDKGNYAAYRREWRKQFTIREPEIVAACADLIHVQAFSRASIIPDDKLLELTSTRWFHERVFDKFLWSNAGS